MVALNIVLNLLIDIMGGPRKLSGRAIRASQKRSITSKLHRHVIATSLRGSNLMPLRSTTSKSHRLDVSLLLQL
jgi:hypothetical protein